MCFVYVWFKALRLTTYQVFSNMRVNPGGCLFNLSNHHKAKKKHGVTPSLNSDQTVLASSSDTASMTSRQYSSLLSSPLNKLLPSKPALLSATAVDVPAMFETKCQRAGVWPAGCPGLLAWSWIFAVFSQSEGGERLVSGEVVVEVHEGTKGGVLGNAKLLERIW
jgi:hypothetical protein